MEIKSRILIGNYLLGSLIYFKDKENRSSLKLSFKNKIADLVKYSETPTNLPAVLSSQEPESLDVSFKFSDRLLETKQQSSQNVTRQFHKIDLPVSTCLFVLRIKDYTLLNQVSDKAKQLVLTPPTSNTSVAVIFSFLGTDGHPFKPSKYELRDMGVVDIPETELSKFSIGIADDSNNNEPNNLIIEFFKPAD